MKFSEAMLKGFEMVGGKQCRGWFCTGGDSKLPLSVCVMGAYNLAQSGDAEAAFGHLSIKQEKAFAKHWGAMPADLNDDGLHWTEIYGMAVAAGL